MILSEHCGSPVCYGPCLTPRTSATSMFRNTRISQIERISVAFLQRVPGMPRQVRSLTVSNFLQQAKHKIDLGMVHYVELGATTPPPPSLPVRTFLATLMLGTSDWC